MQREVCNIPEEKGKAIGSFITEGDLKHGKFIYSKKLRLKCMKTFYPQKYSSIFISNTK